MGFPRQEYWSGLPFPPPGDLPDPGIKPMSSALQADSLPLGHLGSRGLVELGLKGGPFLAFVSNYKLCMVSQGAAVKKLSQN